MSATATGYLASKPRYEILDGLRGVAAMIVVAFHLLETYSKGPAYQVLNHGYLAVDFFFVLSGFVIGYAYDDRWTRHLASLYQALSIVLTLLGTVVFLLVLLVIFASVRLTTNAQKDEIRALYLFGATRSFIKRPYCWRGVLTLMLAAVLSLAITALGIHLLAQPIADFASLYGVRIELRMPASDWCLLYVAAASILGGLVGSFAASDAITRMRSPH